MESGGKFGADGAGGNGSHATPLGVQGEGGNAAGLDANLDKGKNILSVQTDGNLDRQIVPAASPAAQDQMGDEDEYVFKEDEEAIKMQPHWMAIARYYSGKPYSTWGMFSELSSIWGKKEPIPVRELGNNRFLVELDSERLWKRVVGEGLWRHKGDAVIFVPYDGICRLSEVAINSIAMWV